MRPANPDVTISARLLLRVVILLIAVWTFVCGLVLVLFQGTSAGALGFDLADRAGQRLVGAHLLILVPVFVLIAWRIEQYHSLLWLPFAAQLVVVISVGYSIVSGDTDFGDGALAVVVSAIFVGLLSFVWVTEQRTIARFKLEDEDDDNPSSAPRQPPDQE